MSKLFFTEKLTFFSKKLNFTILKENYFKCVTNTPEEAQGGERGACKPKNETGSKSPGLLNKTLLVDDKQNTSHHPPGNTATTLACRERGFLHRVGYSFKTLFLRSLSAAIR